MSTEVTHIITVRNSVELTRVKTVLEASTDVIVHKTLAKFDMLHVGCSNLALLRTLVGDEASISENEVRRTQTRID